MAGVCLTDSPPVISSHSGALTVDLDHSPGVTHVTTVTASDPNSDPLSYSIACGCDASLFSVNSSSGDLSFIAAPDINSPLDCDGDNIYEVEVRATAGGFRDTQTFNITVTNGVTPTPTATDTSTPTPTDTSTGTPTPTDTIITTVTPTDTSTVTPTGTGTGTVTVPPYTTIPPITTIDVPILPPVTTIEVNPKCSASFTELKASDYVVKPRTSVEISWDTINAKEVYIVNSSKIYDPTGNFHTTFEKTTEFTFVAKADNCETPKDIKVSVVNILPWETGLTIGGGALIVETALMSIATFFSASGSPFIQQGIKGNMLFAIAGFIDKKRKKKWGIVYDSVTKQPIPRAVIRMQDSKTDETVETVVTDARGVFNINAVSGVYLLKVVHAQYEFPSKVVTEKDDGGYANVYRGEILEIKDDDKQVMVSIPLDSKEIDGAELAKYNVKRSLGILASSSSTGLILAGFIYSIYAAITYPHIYNYVVVGAYGISALIKVVAIMMDNPKTHGEVKDTEWNPVEGLEIGLYDSEFKTLLYRTFTSEAGKYNFAASNNEYELKIMDSNYVILNQGLEFSSIPIAKSKKTGLRLITNSFVVKKK